MLYTLAYLVALFNVILADDDGGYEELLSIDEYQPSRDKVIGSIDIVDEMHFELDIEVHSLGSGGWHNILHSTPTGGNCCGAGTRMPAIFMHSSNSPSRGFYVMFGNSQNGDPWIWTHNEAGAVVAGGNYHVTIDVNQTWITVTVNGETVQDESKPSHPTYQGSKVYGSDPWYNAADATVTNLLVGNGPAPPPTEQPSIDPTPSPTDEPTTEPSAEPTFEPTEEPTRDCSVFHIDEFLMDCSVEFDGHGAHIDTLKSDVSAMKDELDGDALDIAALQDTVSKLVNATAELESTMNAMNAEMQLIVEALDRMGDYP